MPTGSIGMLRRLAPSAPLAAQADPSFVVSDAVLQLMATTVEVGDATGIPDIDSRSGSLFAAVGEERWWYLPRLALATASDASFDFVATQESADAEGDPFNVATLTLGIEQHEPEDVVQFRSEHPDAAIDPIAFTSLDGVLVLSYRHPDGTVATREVPATMAGEPLVLTATLLGPDVLLAFTALTATADAALRIRCSYTAAGFHPAPPPDEPGPNGGRWPRPRREWYRDRIYPLRPTEPDPIAPKAHTFSALRTARIDRAVVSPLVTAATSPAFLRESALRLDHVMPLPIETEPAGTWVRTVSTEVVPLLIGDAFASVAHRPRYRIERGGTSQVIVTTEDLAEFDHHRSEFVELTTLGQISDRYPTLRAVYLGRVSGTVVAVPARYGLIRTAAGLAASLDAAVDPSPASSGARFHLSFGVAPCASPFDLAGLSHELAAHPALARLVTRVSLPSRLAPTAPLSFAGAGATISALAVGDGADPGSFVVDFDVVDGVVPAIAAVNVVLKQLSAQPLPTMIGRLAFELDDSFDEPLASTTVLAFSTTVGDDDIVVVAGEGGAYRLSNTGPLAVRVTGITAQPADGAPVRLAVDLVVPPGSDVDGPAIDGAVLGVEAVLVEPLGGFDGSLADYLRITLTDVQQMRVTVGVNAAGALAGSIARLDVTASLRGMPGVALPVMTLVPAVPLQQVVWQVPLTGGLLGLPADVAVHVTGVDGSTRDVTLVHDFADAPILVLGVEDLRL